MGIEAHGDVILEIATPQAKPIVMLVVAFLCAVERFRAAAYLASQPDGQIPGQISAWTAAAEALSWVDAIDQYFTAEDKARAGGGSWNAALGPEDVDLGQVLGSGVRV